MPTSIDTTDLIVFSHLRWDFVFQRPQHLMMRHAKNRRVFYMEEPVFGMTEFPRIHLRVSKEGVTIVVPYLPAGTEASAIEPAMRELVDELIDTEDLQKYSVWYYTPMALGFTDHLNPVVTMFDCMDELSLFHGAPRILVEREAELLSKADLVFTGGHSLYEAKKHRHHNIHPFPSSIDFTHFAKGRESWQEPADQSSIPHPRVGFYGVIDERMNIDLLREMAELEPSMHLVIVGPIVKIDPATLPQRENIHYLGKKEYDELPLYLAGWDCAMMPFALNDSTRFISPTKTPEYLAAGKPVVSTSITDVIHPYADQKLVHIADTAADFVSCIKDAMTARTTDPKWLAKIDSFLMGNSWDETFSKIADLERKVSDLAVNVGQLQSERTPEFSACRLM